MNVGFISLGCSKNLVVTEEIIGLFKKHNFNIVTDEKDADILIINTCGFIESAKKEAIDTILEMAEYKKDKCKYLIVVGCLVGRYKDELVKLLPEVDLFISIKEYPLLWEKINMLINNKLSTDNLDFHKRYITTGNITAYLKIAEGCSNGCTYCAIPLIQGKYVSREFDDIIKEAKELASNGYQELIVIAQDTGKYGYDLYGRNRLSDLLKELNKIKGIKWIRFLYTYPETIDDELIKTVKECDKVCKYFDMPIQHINDNVLKNMHRISNGNSIKELILHLRKEIPNVIIRTTLIAGFPCETDDEFNELCNFVNDYKIDKLGCFAYSKEDGTYASIMKGQIKEKIKKERQKKIMSLQQNISKEIMNKYIGNTYEVLIEDVTEDGEYFIGRSYMDVPNEDGVIFIKYNSNYALNEFVNCRITSALVYDLVGEITQ
jgi:ribosomal protein S12 methylthiotransferase